MSGFPHAWQPLSRAWGGWRRYPFVRRMLLLLFVLTGEALVISVSLDTARLEGRGGVLSGWIGMAGAWGVRAALAFAALLATFGYLRHGEALMAAGARLPRVPVNRSLVLCHCLALATFGVLSRVLFGTGAVVAAPDAFAAGWLVSGAGVAASIGLALIPAAQWRELIRATGLLWLYAAGGSLVGCAAGSLSWKLWRPTAQLTFYLVQAMLGPLLPGLWARPATLDIGTQAFNVTIAPECSGLEGVGLLLIFSTVWLVLFRREVRFPRALALIPAAVVVLFLLNAVRIAALILIGNAGAEEIALGGFHSQAGWIEFNAVAFGIAIAARRIGWFAAPSGARRAVRQTVGESPATPAYLLPFLAILAAGMVARAASGQFEWYYWLRFPAAITALAWSRRTYAKPAWEPDWFAPLVGGGVFLMWIGLDRLLGTPQAYPAAALIAASRGVRLLWIGARIAGAVAIVPIAEELAFRGYLMRRLAAVDFEHVSLAKISRWAVLGSSLAFGVLHGRLWFAGVLAGAAYALATRQRGRLGDAMVAHAVTNALLAAYVLAFSRWDLW